MFQFIRVLISGFRNKLLNEKYVLTEEHKEFLNILENTNNNIFLTGKAGTGKTALIQYFREKTKKSIIVLAPTGIAALNIRGQTIHSFFKFPPTYINFSVIKKLSKSLVYSNIDCLIIDEISMVRADLLDGIDQFLRIHGRDRKLPFGGIQIVIVGDMYQLPPVVSKNDSDLLRNKYLSSYFFSAEIYKEAIFKIIELKTIFRQKDLIFTNLLNQIRVGEVSNKSLEPVNQRVINKSFSDAYIILCTTNQSANGINNNRLLGLKETLFVFHASTEGIFPIEDRNLPVEIELKLKKNAKVLFVKNDAQGRWVNGSMGIVYKLNHDNIEVKLNSGKIVTVNIETWDNIKYQLNEETTEIVSSVIGKLFQYPLRLAWAITIHKSQGMSFDKVCVDFTASPFAHGQTYVALSRCRTLEGLVLTKAIIPTDIVIDNEIKNFYNQISSL